MKLKKIVEVNKVQKLQIDVKSKTPVLIDRPKTVEILEVKNIGISQQEQNDRKEGKFKEYTEDEDGN